MKVEPEVRRNGLGGRTSVLDRQRRDHADLDKLLVALGDGTSPESDEVLLRVYRLVFAHAFAEEAVLWPAIRRCVSNGGELTLRVEQEHQEINELVIALEQMPRNAPERVVTIRRMVDLLREDVRNEEDVLLPLLEESLSPGADNRLGVRWELVRRTAPTRAHPMVARRPPGNVLSALPLSLIDRLRDRTDAASEHRTTEPRLLSSSRRALAHLARRTERLALFGVGEHPSTHRR